MGVPGDGNSDVDERGDEGPDEARDCLRPAAEDLEGEANAVDVGAVILFLVISLTEIKLNVGI